MVLLYQMKEKDSFYINKIKNGKIDYFRFIVDRYIDKVYSYFYQRLREKQDSEDLTQETFINFYKNINRFNENEPVLPYLLTIASNNLKMFYRRNKKTMPLTDSIRIDDDYEKIENKLSLEELSLTEKEKKIIDLVAEGYTYREIGKMLKLKENSIKAIVRRLRLKIKKDNERKYIKNKDY
jgi:RNA polymerase sigma-70 factor (ECF subfamily)